ncbi:LuxR C-terminal-related transcriptional regulator [Kitasatospora herbaricolor]|uniref:LuxR C-terminal-related transcriptional regulator n=1 Tax=Kitasatospora herbaricolor TaxID=68217 RepID=UPI0036DF4F61
MIDALSRKPLRVMIVDESPVVRIGLRTLLNADTRLTMVGEATNGRKALILAQQLRPDVVLLDNCVPDPNGLNTLRHLIQISRVLVMTYSHEPLAVESAMRLGASGYLVHGDFSPDELTRAILRATPDQVHLSPRATSAVLSRLHMTVPAQAVAQDPHADALTPREREIMDLISQGLSNSRIANKLVLSEKTVKNHVNHIFGKLHAANRAEAMACWLGTAGQRAYI